MVITKARLKEIIQEEISHLLNKEVSEETEISEEEEEVQEGNESYKRDDSP